MYVHGLDWDQLRWSRHLTKSVSTESGQVKRRLHKRKDWLFIGAQERGSSNAVLMSLVGTCKALGVNPREYLRDVLARLNVETDVERLTPLGWKRDQAAAQRAAAARQAIANVLRDFARPRV